MFINTRCIIDYIYVIALIPQSITRHYKKLNVKVTPSQYCVTFSCSQLKKKISQMLIYSFNYLFIHSINVYSVPMLYFLFLSRLPLSWIPRSLKFPTTMFILCTFWLNLALQSLLLNTFEILLWIWTAAFTSLSSLYHFLYERYCSQYPLSIFLSKQKLIFS